MVAHVIVLTLVMLLAGVFGGLINYYLLNQNNKDVTTLARCIVVAVGAAFLVPVVLDLVASDIVGQSQGDAGKLLIYTGLCLIAAIGSRLVVTNTVDRTLRASEQACAQVEALKHQIRDLQDVLQPLLETETELEAGIGTEDTKLLEELDVTATQVMKSLATGRYIFRTPLSLVREAGQEEQDVLRSLNVLMARGLAGKIHSVWGVRWHLSERGRRLAESLD
ncbi:hypothetical protein SAMN05421831_101355 [Allopseudospirillum japonicum]|uniref:YEATS-Like-Associating Three TM domain-containing protein n=1 Tax=Allopseudospirillum japonicum TaxID=64971 RepID=A0A1H6QBE9_9GAMM|nr:YEATS-associated helix-containing protein [Allopseudospirillum japonicum]SEI41073.1 hypothetical protein SAMN05421831_101355 [Allopseudospirillum japonicum]